MQKRAIKRERVFGKLVLRYLPRPPYRNVAPAPGENNDLEDMEFWVLGEKDALEECHIIMEDAEYGILLSFYGAIQEEEIVKKENQSFWQKLFQFKREKNMEKEDL